MQNWNSDIDDSRVKHGHPTTWDTSTPHHLFSETPVTPSQRALAPVPLQVSSAFCSADCCTGSLGGFSPSSSFVKEFTVKTQRAGTLPLPLSSSIWSADD